MTASKDEQLEEFISDLWASMTRIVKRRLPTGGRLASDYELTRPQVFALWQLKEYGPMTMGRLSELLSVTHGVATRMVDRLLKKGMIERHRDENDRRVVQISLTILGAEVIAEVGAGAMSVIRGVFKNVPKRDREEFLALMHRIEKAQVGGSSES